MTLTPGVDDTHDPVDEAAEECHTLVEKEPGNALIYFCGTFLMRRSKGSESKRGWPC